MKRLLAVAVLLALAHAAMAADATCTITNLTPRQQVWAGNFVALQNIALLEEDPGATPYTDISDYCTRTTEQRTLPAYLQEMRKLMAEALAQAALEHGDETAPTAQCTYAGLSAGCVKFEVACFILSGSATCE